MDARGSLREPDYHVKGILRHGQWINDGFYEGVPALGVCANNWRPTPFGILKILDESSAMIPSVTTRKPTGSFSGSAKST